MQSRGYLYASLSVATIPWECRTRKTGMTSNMAEEARGEGGGESVYGLALPPTRREGGSETRNSTACRKARGRKYFKKINLSRSHEERTRASN